MNLRYDSIKINDVDVTLSSTVKASFISPYNNIVIKITSTDNDSIDIYQVRVTKLNEDYDIDVGIVAAFHTNLAAGVQHTINVPINATTFPYGDITYRVSLYARSAGTGKWDVTYLFMVWNDAQTEHIKFVPSGSSGMTVSTYKDVSN